MSTQDDLSKLAAEVDLFEKEAAGSFDRTLWTYYNNWVEFGYGRVSSHPEDAEDLAHDASHQAIQKMDELADLLAKYSRDLKQGAIGADAHKKLFDVMEGVLRTCGGVCGIYQGWEMMDVPSLPDEALDPHHHKDEMYWPTPVAASARTRS